MKLGGLVVSETELLSFVSQFPLSCISERFIYFRDRSACFDAAKYADQSWGYINCSHIHECRNWERGHAVLFLGICKLDFWYSVGSGALN